MEYLATIENTDYYHWQIELLIESFKLHGIQDKLAIGIVDQQKPIRKNFTKNLKQHKRVFFETSHSSEYSPINQSYLTYIALKNKVISQPFTLIHSDTVLVNPKEEIKNNIVFSISPYFLPALEKTIDVNKIINQQIPLGGVYKFNNMPISFFQSVVERIQALTHKWIKTGDNKWKRVWKYANQMAWMSAFLQDDSIDGVQIESQLFESISQDTEFIHYSNGFLPFHKISFKYNSEIDLNEKNPFEIFSDPQYNINPTTNCLFKVSRSYNESKCR
jgi:hypothetical protein